MNKQTDYNWYKLTGVVEEITFKDNCLAEVMVNDKKVCIGLYKDELFACVAQCPHAGGLLADGYIDAFGNIICPVHRYKFNLKNGRNASGEGYYLTRYKLEHREDGIYIALEK